MKKIIFIILGLLVKVKILTPIRIAKLRFLYFCRRWPDFQHPRDINEKINWMKFYGDTSQWPLFADKYKVRTYVKECGFEDILVPLLGKWDTVDEVDWDSLPERFVMKCNNGSGDVLVCEDKSKLDIEKTKRHFRKHLAKKLGINAAEPHYDKIKPCVIAEEMLDISTQPCGSVSMVDYKIWVFGGKPQYVWCAWNRKQYHANVALYDLDWNFRPEYMVWTSHYVKPTVQLPKPVCFDRMMEIASKLAGKQPAVRIDLYVCGDKIYFGEMTMTSQAGFMDNFTDEFLNIMGDMTKLPTDK